MKQFPGQGEETPPAAILVVRRGLAVEPLHMPCGLVEIHEELATFTDWIWPR